MAEITAGMVKDLRERTDAPMMECKRALTEAAGDMAKAEEILRVKLGNKANKAASRVTAEGMVAVHIGGDGAVGAMVEINCETDFVAKNPEFSAFAAALAGLVAKHAPADVAALSTLDLEGATVEDARRALIGRIGENITIRRFARVAAKGRLASYVHGGSKIGVLVDVTGGADGLARELAMHIAASRPLAVSREGVPEHVVRKEQEIAAAKAQESGKPAAIMQKMVDGAVQKFFREVTLLGQPFVKDDKQTVEQLLASQKAQVSEFVLYVVGEGIERKRDDFAAEVMAQVGQARQTDGRQVKAS